ncbi:hypothetical protein CDEST_01989 [Colletotrichum destructivum]|uniref:Secreted protein n=1 Tax=Colletotrichum destructivum TaxID=34406 RepID=A0AAX4I0S9_9PEZI|nr:hypothetical protein CDEST_01989 [Colletotrichum destructivum]
MLSALCHGVGGSLWEIGVGYVENGIFGVLLRTLVATASMAARSECHSVVVWDSSSSSRSACVGTLAASRRWQADQPWQRGATVSGQFPVIF